MSTIRSASTVEATRVNLDAALVDLTHHAIARMALRGISMRNVALVFATAHACVHHAHGTTSHVGRGLDGRDIVVVTEAEDRDPVITRDALGGPLMHATYDQRARTIAIQLEDDARQDRTDEVALGAIAGLRDGRIVEVELIGVGSSDDLDRIIAVSARYDLDLEALAAAFRAALVAPGRRVAITVTARAA